MADFMLSARTMNLDGLRSSFDAKTHDVHLSHGGFHRRFRPVRRSSWIFVYVTPHWKSLNRCPHGWHLKG